jgi:hypothetical protein
LADVVESLGAAGVQSRDADEQSAAAAAASALGSRSMADDDDDDDGVAHSVGNDSTTIASSTATAAANASGLDADEFQLHGKINNTEKKPSANNNDDNDDDVDDKLRLRKSKHYATTSSSTPTPSVLASSTKPTDSATRRSGKLYNCDIPLRTLQFKRTDSYVTGVIAPTPIKAAPIVGNVPTGSF